MWKLFKNNNKDTRTTSLWSIYCLLWIVFTHCSAVSIVDFEKGDADWVTMTRNKRCTSSDTAWSVQIRSFFWSIFSRIRTEYGEILISPYSVFSSNAGKHGPEKTTYLDTFHAVRSPINRILISQRRTHKNRCFYSSGLHINILSQSKKNITGLNISVYLHVWK